MRIWRRIYSTYCLVLFGLIFLVMLPFFLLFMIKKEWYPYALKLNYLWSRLYFFLCFIPVSLEWRFPLDKNVTYIFTANHTSWFDIVMLGYVPKPIVFVGKASIGKLPLFGYMYRKLHITLDRNNLRSRYAALEKAKRVIDEGFSLGMFPEGGIRTTNPPQMVSFKDGPFRVAIEKQVPIVPVTIPFNWMCLPEDGSLLVYRRKLKIIFHEPISTKGLTLADLEHLKSRVFKVIDEELKRQNKPAVKRKIAVKNE